MELAADLAEVALTDAVASGRLESPITDPRQALEPFKLVTPDGTLPFGLTVDDLVRDHDSKPRNPLLAELFYRRGFDRLVGPGDAEDHRPVRVAAGHPPPEFKEQAGSVVVRFIPKGNTPPHRVDHDLTERQRRILHALRDGAPRAMREIRESLQPSPPERTVRDDLKLLRTLGLVTEFRRGPGARWQLRSTNH